MHRQFGFLFIALAAAPALAGPMAVTLSGNFGVPQGGSSVFDNQNYAINFLIPDPSSPPVITCCLAQISATYDVIAHLAVPGIGLSLDNALQVQYNSQLPLGKWLNIFSFTGLPAGDFMVLSPFQINSGELWNGLAGALGTPVITPLNGAPGTGVWHLEQNTPDMGPIPIAFYSDGAMTITAVSVPEPTPAWLLAGALLALICGGAGWYPARRLEIGANGGLTTRLQVYNLPHTLPTGLPANSRSSSIAVSRLWRRRLAA